MASRESLRGGFHREGDASGSHGIALATAARCDFHRGAPVSSCSWFGVTAGGRGGRMTCSERGGRAASGGRAVDGGLRENCVRRGGIPFVLWYGRADVEEKDRARLVQWHSTERSSRGSIISGKRRAAAARRFVFNTHRDCNLQSSDMLQRAASRQTPTYGSF